MRPWRLVTEIGWTGGGVLAYPLVLCRDALARMPKRRWPQP